MCDHVNWLGLLDFPLCLLFDDADSAVGFSVDFVCELLGVCLKEGWDVFQLNGKGVGGLCKKALKSEAMCSAAAEMSSTEVSSPKVY